MRAIKIDPREMTVTEIELEGPSSYKALKAALNGATLGAVTIGRLPDGGMVTMYVDDDGLLVDQETQTYFTFWNKGRPGQLYAGVAIVTGTDQEGETVALSPLVELEKMRQLVTFLGDKGGAINAISNRIVEQPVSSFTSFDKETGEAKTEELWRWS